VNVLIKNTKQIDQIEENGKILREIINGIVEYTEPGMTSIHLDKKIEDSLLKRGSLPTFKGYRGFPGSACISINDVLVHGIPSEDCVIKDGDVVSIDIGVTKNNCIADSCYTYIVGSTRKQDLELVSMAHKATMYGISICKPDLRLHELAKAIFEFVDNDSDFTITRGLYGHGTGVILHEPPTISYTYPVEKEISNMRLVEGMVITIEPVIGYKSSKGDFTQDSDGWTLRSIDGSYGAQFEHTIAITSTGNKILTGQFLEKYT